MVNWLTIDIGADLCHSPGQIPHTRRQWPFHRVVQCPVGGHQDRRGRLSQWCVDFASGLGEINECVQGGKFKCCLPPENHAIKFEPLQLYDFLDLNLL